MMPTKDRNQNGILISYGSEKILVDCGEGIQRQLKIVGVSLAKINRVLISHLHGDHVLGLPGLIQSMGNSDYQKTLHIYGPIGTKKFVRKLFDTFIFNKQIGINVIEVKSRRVFQNDDFFIETYPIEHGVPTQGYSIIEKDKRKINVGFITKEGIKEGPLLGKLQAGKDIRWNGKKIKSDDATKITKGKKVSIIFDTVPCKSLDNLAKDSDLLICEATYLSNLEEKAKEHKHMTSKQAADLAKRNNVKRLVLTHFSARYKSTKELVDEAKKICKNVVAARDFLKLEV